MVCSGAYGMMVAATRTSTYCRVSWEDLAEPVGFREKPYNDRFRNIKQRARTCPVKPVQVSLKQFTGRRFSIGGSKK